MVLREIPSRGLNQGKSLCVLCVLSGGDEYVSPAPLTKQPRECIPRCPWMHPRHLAHQVGGTVFIFLSFLDLRIFDDSISSVPRPCLGQEMVRPARLPRPMRGGGCPPIASAIVEVSPPKPGAALSQGEGVGGRTAAETLRGEGDTAGHGDTQGACALPLTQLKAPCTVSTGMGSQGMEGGAKGGVMIPHHPNQDP
jgi:hypothetical protein